MDTDRPGDGVAYDAYFRSSPDAYARVVASLDRVETLYAYLVSTGLLDGVESILSIGAGYGDVEIRLAKATGCRLAVVEPSAMYVRGFTERAGSAGLEPARLEVFEGPFERYEPARGFDLVLALFSWFAFETDRDALERALACRTEGGRLLICLQEEDCPSTAIAARSRAAGIALTSQALSRWASGLGFDHTYDVYHGTVPASRFVDDRGLTRTGRDFVSFLMATPWDRLGEAERRFADETMRAAVRGDTLDFACGCLIFP